MLTDQEIIKAIEDIDSIWPSIPGQLEYLELKHMTGCITPYDTFFMNRISKANLAGTELSEEIEKIKSLYTARKKPFAWIVGPNSAPSDLSEKLLAAGFQHEGKNDGMVLRRLELPIEINPSLRIEELPLDNLEPLVPVLTKGFGMGGQATRDYFAMLQFSSATILSRVFVAYNRATGEPIASGTLTYFPGKPLGILGGAATVPEHRGQGSYSALVKARLDVAREDKLEAVVIAASRKTSSPICQKFGFERLCEIDFYSYGKL